jgi:glycosyltransferase involved in cell wall biosynthesis
MRVVILFDHFGPYHIARVAALSRFAKVLALQTRSRSSEYSWSIGPEPTFQLHTLHRDGGDPACVLAIRRMFSEFLPDIVALPGWSDRVAIAGMKEAARWRLPVVLMSESTAYDSCRRPWKEIVKRDYVSLASSALVGGAPHRAYLRQLGMPDDRIFEGYDAVDNDTFARGAACWREVDGPQTPYFLASNRFIEKKNLFRLLSAYAIYLTKDQGPGTKDRHPWPLVLLGDGELRTALLAHARILGLTVLERAPWESPTRNEEPGTKNRPAVYLPGFRQIDELPRFYAHAGAFVHASTTEQWGLVVNEAMAGGLPVIVSNRCGCAPDLVRDGQNGWTFDPLDETALAGLLGRVAALDDVERTRLGEAGREIIGDWGPERFAVGLLAAANKAVEVGPKRAGWFDRLLLSLLVRRPGSTE